MEPLPSSPAQRRAVLWATLAAAALIAHQVAGRATRDALFLSNFDVRYLPPTMMAASALAMIAVLLMSRLLSQHPPTRVVPLAVGAGAVLLLAEWALSLAAPGLAAIAVYLHMALFGATLVSGFWSVVNERFDPYTAKRVVGRIGTGAAVGGVVGGALAWGVSRAVPVPATLLVMAALTIAALWSLVSMGPPIASGTGRIAAGPVTPTGALASLRIVRRTPYLTSLTLIVGLSALIEALLDYALGAEAKRAFASEPAALMSFFSLYHTGVGLVSLLVQGALARRALESLGLAGSVASKPATYAIGGLLAALSPRLVTATLARALPAILHNSLFRSGYELLFTPLPEQIKRPTKSIVDVGADKAGAFLGSGLAFALVWAAPGLTPEALFVVAALLGVAVLGVCRGVHRGYVGALEQSLRSGAVTLDSSDIVDSTTRLTLARTNMSLERETLLQQVRALRQEQAGAGEDAAPERPPDTAAPGEEDPLIQAIVELRRATPRAVRRVLASTELPVALVPHVIPLLGRNELFLDALHALRKAAPRATGLLTDALLDPGQPPTVRRRLPRVLKACPTQRALEGLRLGLGDTRFDVRFECGVALSRLKSSAPELSVPKWDVYDLVLRELARDIDPGQLQDRQLEHVFNLLSLVLEKEPLRISYWALRAEDDPGMRGTALEYLENVLPERIRVGLWPLMGVSARRDAAARPRRDLVEELVRQSQTSILLREQLQQAEEEGEEA